MSSVSTKPYLVRAIYEWCVDQGFTPYVAAIVDEATRVPPGAARDGQIVLNMSPDATSQLDLGNDLITFQARFGGVAHAISLPIDNVVAIYARENGHGMAFEIEGAGAASDDATTSSDSDAAAEHGPTDADALAPAGSEAGPPKPDKPSGGGRSHLKVIK